MVAAGITKSATEIVVVRKHVEDQLDATGLNGHVRTMFTLQREYASRSQ